MWCSKKKRSVSKKHDCSHNKSGSAKAMEPAIACEMIQSIYDDGAKVYTILWIYIYKIATYKVTQGSLDINLT